MQLPNDINEYLRARASELAERILRTFPPLHGIDDPESPLIGTLLRKPFTAQVLAMMGVVKRWNEARGAAVIAECGTGKTLISLGSIHVHSDRKPFTALGHGSTAIGREVGERGASNAAPRAGLLH